MAARRSASEKSEPQADPTIATKPRTATADLVPATLPNDVIPTPRSSR